LNLERKLAGLCLIIGLAFSILGEKLAMGLPDATIIPGVLDLRHTYNHGISFSLLWQNGDAGRYVLSAGLMVVIAAVGFLAWQAKEKLAASGYGLIIGGALANLADRSLYGAVFDYLSFHLGATPFFVFNAADAAISLGVVLLVAEAILPKPQSI
jgi:signal peptidase II